MNLPSYTNSNKPTGIDPGFLVFNSETFQVEVWTGTVWAKVGGGSAGFGAVGGTVLDVGNYRIHTYEGSGSFIVNSAPAGAVCEVLVVAGGGAGAHWYAGGGGAGGVVYATNVQLSEGTYNITVGDGGTGMPPGTPASGVAAYGGRGQDSSFGTSIIATGGGGAPGYNASPSDSAQFQYIDGGSGGGGRLGGYGDRGYPYRSYTPTLNNGICQTFGQQGGVQGGTNGGGGGGAGEPGEGGAYAAKGGDGIFLNFDGTDRYYAAGGGGGMASGSSSGGVGGGGAGNSGTTNGGDATGYGSGGGSCGSGNSNYQSYKGGDGSKGVVMIRYKTKDTTVQVYNTVGSSTWTVPDGATSVEVLLIAGGGGGAGSNTTGSGPRGGGGAGGFIWKPHYAVTSGQSISYSVGGGGAGGTGSGEVDGVSGSNSTFGNLTAVGGGGGGTYISATQQGYSGGSGGGNSYVAGTPSNAGTAYQGYRGGTGQKYGNDGASGGGGAGSAGYDTRQIGENGSSGGGGDRGSNAGGDGGAGRLCPISGSPNYYAGGGGAGGYPSGTTNFGIGGSNVGGTGAHGGSTATSGIDGTGSGGGAGGSSSKGASGGNGVVIISY
jgi:hypothetical protein